MTKTGIFNWYGYIQPFEERIELIKKAGYDYVMLWWDDEIYPRFIDRRELVKIVGDYGLMLDNVHLPFEDTNLLWSEDINERNKKTEQVIRWMHECRECGVETIVMHTTHGGNLVLNHSVGYDSFEKITKVAEDIKLMISLENTRVFRYTDFLLSEIDSDYIGFCYDSSHDFVNGESMGEILNKWKNRLFSVHLSDNDGLCDRHWIPGKGHVDWKRIIPIIKKTGCKSFSMEAYPFEEEKELAPFDFLMKARDNLLERL